MRSLFSAVAVTASVIALPASAAVVIDNFDIGGGPFSAVQDASGQTSTTGAILGGARDLSATITAAQIVPGDPAAASARIQNTANTAATMKIAFGGAAHFEFNYDGAGVGGSATGLNFDAATAGSGIDLQVIVNLILAGNLAAPTDLTVRLTDEAGQMASLTRSFATGEFPQTRTYGFAAFEAANTALDLRNIFRISILSDQRIENPFFDSQVGLNGVSVTGAAYTPTNHIGGVPEASTWALMIGGFGLSGHALRTRRQRTYTA